MKLRTVAAAAAFGALLASCALNVELTETCADPVFDPPPGTFRDAFTLALATDTSDATIYYTTNLVAPTAASIPYTGPIAVSSSTRIMAIAMKEGAVSSRVVYGEYGVGWTAETFAGLPLNQGSDDGIGSAARFAGPNGIASDGTSLFVCDQIAHTIRRIDLATRAATTFAGTPMEPGYVDDFGSDARFHEPWGIATDGTYLYVSEYLNSAIRKIAIATGEVTTFASILTPFGLCIAGDSLYVCDSSSSSIQRVALATGIAVPFADFAPTTPVGIATDGSALFAVMFDQTVRRIELTTGVVTDLAGQSGYPGYANGVGAAARFSYPVGIASDGTNLYIADTDNATIRRIAIAGGETTTIAGIPLRLGSDDGVGTEARFDTPRGIVWDGNALFVTDYYNCTILTLF